MTPPTSAPTPIIQVRVNGRLVAEGEIEKVHDELDAEFCTLSTDNFWPLFGPYPHVFEHNEHHILVTA